MNSIADLIAQSRKSRNLTQEQLADLAKVNLRTIQRIENNENNPRGKTLELICDVLGIAIPISDAEIKVSKPNYIDIAIQYFFLLILNLTLMGIIGWMTLDTAANLNTRFAGFLLSFFIPIFIVYLTPHMKKTERLLKFGTGFLFYIVFSIFMIGFTAFLTGLLPCLSIALCTLYYGEVVISTKSA